MFLFFAVLYLQDLYFQTKEADTIASLDAKYGYDCSDVLVTDNPKCHLQNFALTTFYFRFVYPGGSPTFGIKWVSYLN